MLKRMLCAAAVSLAAGCASQVVLPVTGVFDQRADKFLGSVSADLTTGTGRLTVNSQQGMACSGGYTPAADGITGSGNVTCADGQMGAFVYTSRGREGEGFGKLQGGDTFSFHFGSPAAGAQQAREVNAIARGLQSLGEGVQRAPAARTECTTSGGLTTCSTR